jgi:hypothetical protein
MVDNLKMGLVPIEGVDPGAFDTIALVDSQPETGNNSLPPGHRIDIVVDHHPLRPGSARAAWCDIRPELGATSTIVFEYLRSRAVPIDTPLATAFFFALRTETRDLGRESTEAERRAYLALVPLVDHALLYRMTHPKVPRAHFAALDRALRSAQVFGDLVAVNLGALGYPDLVAEIADLLLSYEGARYVLCMGQYEDSPYLSLRTKRTTPGRDGDAPGRRAGRRRGWARHDGRRAALRQGRFGRDARRRVRHDRQATAGCAGANGRGGRAAAPPAPRTREDLERPRALSRRAPRGLSLRRPGRRR